MATKIIKAQITQRHDTRSNWESVNPVLLEGELGLVSDDPNLYKVGDGRTEWNNLPYRGFDGTLVQEEGTSPNVAMSQKAVTEALAKKPDTTGTYPTMRVGTADDLAGRGESVPASFGFRASGGKSIKDGRAYIKRIKGNSVVWNQHLKWRGNDNVYNGLTVTYEDGKIHVQGTPEKSAMIFYSLFYDDSSKIGFITGHYYLIAGNSEHFSLSAYNNVSVSGSNCITQKTGDIMRLMLKVENLAIGQEVNESFFAQVIDLTQMFQAGNEPTTIEEFNARVATLGVDMNAYNEGQVIHCNTESIKSVGDNAWDEQWEIGGLSEVTGQEYDTTANFRSKNYIKILPNTQYYFKKPAGVFLLPYYYDEDKNFIATDDVMFTGQNGNAFTTMNAAYMRFIVNQGNYNNDIMLTLVHSGWKQDTDAGYQPYWQDTLPLPIINKYFPDGMKSAGSAHDEIRFNKATQKWEKVVRIGSVDMGSMAWSYDSANQVFTSYTIMDLMTHPAEVSERNKGLLCSKYSPSNTYVASTMDDKSWLRIPKSVTIKDTSYTDAATFKAAMAGVILYYELAEPIVTEITEDFRDYYNVADFGTEQSQSSVPSAPFSADIIYQFNAVDMIREHELEITELQNVIATMQAQLASLTNNPE